MNDTYILLGHGSRKFYNDIDIKRYKLTNDSIYYLTYTNYGMSIDKNMTYIVKIILDLYNDELKKIINNSNIKEYKYENTIKYISILIKFFINNLKNNINGKINITFTPNKNIKKNKKNKKIIFTIDVYETKYFWLIYSELIKYIVKTCTIDDIYKTKKDKKLILIYLLQLFKFNIVLFLAFKKIEEDLLLDIKNKTKKYKSFIDLYTSILDYINENIETLLNYELSSNEIYECDKFLHFNSDCYKYMKYFGIDDYNVYIENNEKNIYYNKSYNYEKIYEYIQKYKIKDKLLMFGENAHVLLDKGFKFNNFNLISLIILYSRINIKVYNSKYKKKTFPNYGFGIMQDFNKLPLVKLYFKYIDELSSTYDINTNNNDKNESLLLNHKLAIESLINEPKNEYYLNKIDDDNLTEFKTGFFSINDKTHLTRFTFFYNSNTDNDNNTTINKYLTDNYCINKNKINIWCLAYFLYKLKENILPKDEKQYFTKLFFNSNSNEKTNKIVNNINNNIFNYNKLKDITVIIEKYLLDTSKQNKYVHILCCAGNKDTDKQKNKYHRHRAIITNDNNINTETNISYTYNNTIYNSSNNNINTKADKLKKLITFKKKPIRTNNNTFNIEPNTSKIHKHKVLRKRKAKIYFKPTSNLNTNTIKSIRNSRTNRTSRTKNIPRLKSKKLKSLSLSNGYSANNESIKSIV